MPNHFSRRPSFNGIDFTILMLIFIERNPLTSIKQEENLGGVSIEHDFFNLHLFFPESTFLLFFSKNITKSSERVRICSRSQNSDLSTGKIKKSGQPPILGSICAGLRIFKIENAEICTLQTGPCGFLGQTQFKSGQNRTKLFLVKLGQFPVF